MRTKIITASLLIILVSAHSASAFGWFGILDASVMKLSDQTYRLRVNINYGGEQLGPIDPSHPGINGNNFSTYTNSVYQGPNLSEFELSSLGSSQYNPFHDSPCGRTFGSNFWWYHPSMMASNYGDLAAHEFGYDFDYDGSLTQGFDLSYRSLLGWQWSSYGTYQESMTGTMHVDVVPEPSTLMLLCGALGLIGVVGVFGRRRAGAVK
ncbi:MAG: PEP-CTERM sorting domain-containing protein [Candidatus Zixiibacteriota bacterium]